MDKNIIPIVNYQINNPNSKHYLRVDAYYGTTQSTALHNAYGSVITITNNNKDGYLGFGRNLVGKSITIRTAAQGDIDSRGVERVRLVYTIDDNVSSDLEINEYDNPEAKNPTPSLKFKINFI